MLSADADGSAVNPRYSLRQAAQNFIGHAFAPTRQFYGVHAFADAFAVRSSDQDDFIPYRDAPYVADVYNRQVHRDASHNRRVVAADDHPRAIREQPGTPVRVTDGRPSHTAPR